MNQDSKGMSVVIAFPEKESFHRKSFLAFRPKNKPQARFLSLSFLLELRRSKGVIGFKKMEINHQPEE